MSAQVTPPVSAIELEDVTKRFGDGAPVVSGLSLDVGAGEVVVLVGPSGCGKTTTLRMINRLVEPTSGRISVGGRDIATIEPHELRRGIGYVIQQVGLFAHRTVADNVATVPRLLGWDAERIRRRVDELVELVGLPPEVSGRYPAQLSGGQQQRVGVARALAADPPILLMDEPFGAVDPVVRERLQDELRRLQGELRKTIVFVTHDIDEAIRLGDRIAVMNVGGVIEQLGSPAEVLAAPANPFVASFVGAQRGLRRLSLIAVRDVELDTADGDADAPSVAASASLLDALDVILRSEQRWARVVDGDRQLGRLTIDRIAESFR